uniref:Uncharacterized protein n=1 Tax=Rhizophora mucronata TaxID=61149 RepID=A0A2P2QAY2_RHIMU
MLMSNAPWVLFFLTTFINPSHFNECGMSLNHMSIVMNWVKLEKL